MKKYLVMALALVLVASLSVVGTVAYLSDEKSVENTMVMGNVTIEQLEYERVVDANGNPVLGVEGEDFDANYGINQSYKLQEFTQNKPALPAVYDSMAWDEFQQLWNGMGAPGSNDLFDDSMKNVIDKFVFVKNTGNVDAYFRTIVAVEIPEGLDSKMIHSNYSTNVRYDYNDDVDGVQDSSESNFFYTTIDGVRYLIKVATHTEALAPEAISRPSLLQLYLDPAATNEDCALFGETWDVKVVSQAVQAGGFDSADAALDAAFGDINENSHPWAD